MGAAAYNRGTRAIAASISEDARDSAFAFMDLLDAQPRAADACTPFGPLYAYHDRGVWFLECPVTGFARWYPRMNLPAIVRLYHVRATGYDGRGWTLTPTQ